ncbi:MAG: FadR family transcriptional regulator [Rhodospirillaceae bacterium]|nr:MAG: FadR family transcriptional regulator [Rhodospirillaceae bacterium]
MMERMDQTLSKLRQLIEDGCADAEGRIPPERVLSNDLGVGRRSLRRALDILEQEGRIIRHQGRGTFVHGMAATEPVRANGTIGTAINLPDAMAVGARGIAFQEILDHTNPLEVIEVRLSIEPVMARLAAFRASQTDIKRLQSLAEETREATTSAVYEAADAKFHRTIAEAARNALFLAIFDTLHASQRDAGWRRLGENANCYKRQSVHADFHHEISAAIAARKGDRAQEVMQQHLSDIQRHIYQHAFPVSGDTEQ